MPEDSSGDDPRELFRAAVLEKMESRKVPPSDLSAATRIPESRLMTIMGSRPGVALFSDLIALAMFFEISIDSFFT